jgi:hypothetical protein
VRGNAKDPSDLGNRAERWTLVPEFQVGDVVPGEPGAVSECFLTETRLLPHAAKCQAEASVKGVKGSHRRMVTGGSVTVYQL